METSGPELFSASSYWGSLSDQLQSKDTNSFKTLSAHSDQIKAAEHTSDMDRTRIKEEIDAEEQIVGSKSEVKMLRTRVVFICLDVAAQPKSEVAGKHSKAREAKFSRRAGRPPSSSKHRENQNRFEGISRYHGRLSSSCLRSRFRCWTEEATKIAFAVELHPSSPSLSICAAR